jgi:hypothetical protein
LYYPTRDALLRAVHWDFARRQDNLTQLKSSNDVNSTCPVPWGYEYAYPSTCLKARFILNFFNTDNQMNPPLTTAPQLAYPLIGNLKKPVRFFVGTDSDVNNNDSTVILTNMPQAILVYTKRITNPDLFDSLMQEALVKVLAANLEPALSANLSRAKGLMEQAEKIVIEARVANGNEGPLVIDNVAEWIAARGAGYGTYSEGYDFMPWDSLPFTTGF